MQLILKDALREYTRFGGSVAWFPGREVFHALALTRPSVAVSSEPWSTHAPSPVRQRRLIRPHCRWQSGCVVGDRPDLLRLDVGIEDSGDGAGRETDWPSVRCDG